MGELMASNQPPRRLERTPVRARAISPQRGAVTAAAATRRSPALALAAGASQPVMGDICATVWPTRTLEGELRWFDEIQCWTEGFEATTTQRAGIQLMYLENAFLMLEHELADDVGVTLSFGTIERRLDQLLELMQRYALVTQRLAVILRGSLSRVRSRPRVRAFVEHLRAQGVVVGYKVVEPRISMELPELDFVRPDFGRIQAPASDRPEYWQDVISEARIAGLARERLVVAGLDTPRHLELARSAGARFGQGASVRPPYAPHKLAAAA